MKLAIAATALSSVALTAKTNGEILLQSAPPASKMVEGEYKVVCGGNADDTHCCELRLQKDCNLVTRRKSTDPDGPEDFEVSWDSGAHGEDLDCEMFLQGDGNLVIYRNNPSRAPVWATNSNSLDGLSHYYTLEFDSYESCRLQIKQDGAAGEEPFWCYNIDGYCRDTGCSPHCFRMWWENIQLGSELYPSLLLQRGEMISDKDGATSYGVYHHYTMRLQHDCNFILFYGDDKANIGEVTFSSKTSGVAEECYIFGDCDELVLYEGVFDKNKPHCANRGKKLWSMDWDDGNPLCFTYDEPSSC